MAHHIWHTWILWACTSLLFFWPYALKTTLHTVPFRVWWPLRLRPAPRSSPYPDVCWPSTKKSTKSEVRQHKKHVESTPAKSHEIPHVSWVKPTFSYGFPRLSLGVRRWSSVTPSLWRRSSITSSAPCSFFPSSAWYPQLAGWFLLRDNSQSKMDGMLFAGIFPQQKPSIGFGISKM